MRNLQEWKNLDKALNGLLTKVKEDVETMKTLQDALQTAVDLLDDQPCPFCDIRYYAGRVGHDENCIVVKEF